MEKRGAAAYRWFERVGRFASSRKGGGWVSLDGRYSRRLWRRPSARVRRVGAAHAYPCVERTPENEAQTSWAVALLYRCFAASTLAFRFALARLGNPLSGREHTSSMIPSLDSGGGGRPLYPPSSCALFSSLIGPVPLGC